MNDTHSSSPSRLIFEQPTGYWEHPDYAAERKRLEVLMGEPRIYADLLKRTGENGLPLTTDGTRWDLSHYGIVLQEGMFLRFYDEDGGLYGKPDPFLFEGTVHFDAERRRWMATIDFSKLRHLSDDVQNTETSNQDT